MAVVAGARVRVCLVCNESAGGRVPVDAIQRAVKAAGHDIVAALEPTNDGLRHIARRAELVVAAGGDGTVRDVAAAIAGSRVPLAILPLGTANNIAGTLAIRGSLEQIIASWASARAMPLDLGVAYGPWGERRFLESAGTGLLAEGICALTNAPQVLEAEERDDKLAQALQGFGDLLAGLPPRRLHLVQDGDARDAEALLVEVLNMRLVGPALELAPQADPSDGVFAVVLAGPAERAALDRYLRRRRQGRAARLRLPTRTCAQVEIRGCDLIHVDDWTLRVAAAEATVSMRIEHAALSVLVPAVAGSGRG